MSKQILPHELAEIVTGLLVKPELLGELDSLEKHQAFMLDIGQVVAEHCGGEANCINEGDTEENYLSDQYSSPYLSVSPNDSLPSLLGNVWSYYDLDGWENDVIDCDDVDAGEPLSTDSITKVRSGLQGSLSTEECYRVVSINSGHLTQADNDALTAAADDVDETMVMSRETGFFIKLYEDEENAGCNLCHGHSETIKVIIQWAHQSGYRMIEFDCDAQVLAKFPVFNW